VDGQPLTAGISPHSLAVVDALSYPLPDAPSGTISERRTVTSSIYRGAEAEYWIYANPGIDTQRGAPVMVWLDGRGFLGADDALRMRMQTVTDNLAHLGRIPPMVHLLVSAAEGGNWHPTEEDYHTGYYDPRIHQFDEVSDEYGRFLVQELLPAVGREFKLREDGYSRAIYGASSGGTGAFKVGWFAPDEFSRLYPYIASFTAWGWRPRDGIDGGFVLPLWVRREPRKNLRIWLSTGIYDEFDFEHPLHLRARSVEWPALHYAGSQLLGNFEMAQALKTSGYDFRFRCGNTGHSFAQAAFELPESLTWLWRDYDPERTHQVYEPDEEERAQPAYQFGVTNRDLC
jgi:enterochelin esterase family protein